MLVGGERRHDISLLGLGNRPNTKPAAASPVCLGFSSSYNGDQSGRSGQAGARPT